MKRRALIDDALQLLQRRTEPAGQARSDLEVPANRLLPLPHRRDARQADLERGRQAFPVRERLVAGAPRERFTYRHQRVYGLCAERLFVVL